MGRHGSGRSLVPLLLIGIVVSHLVLVFITLALRGTPAVLLVVWWFGGIAVGAMVTVVVRELREHRSVYDDGTPENEASMIAAWDRARERGFKDPRDRR